MKDEVAQRREAIADIQRGEQVQALINNPILIETFAKMKAAHFIEFEKASFTDDDKRRELSQRIKVLNMFEQQLNEDIKRATKAKQTLNLLDRGIEAIRKMKG